LSTQDLSWFARIKPKIKNKKKQKNKISSLQLPTNLVCASCSWSAAADWLQLVRNFYFIFIFFIKIKIKINSNQSCTRPGPG
jgi:hypothetical protein